jgi:RimJ/RimL family protein N-acetyltransferase
MQEACKVINRYWFETLDRPLMQVPKAIGNAASRRVSEREGMRLIEVTEGHFVSGALGKEVWELSREQWLQRS